MRPAAVIIFALVAWGWDGLVATQRAKGAAAAGALVVAHERSALRVGGRF